ncbi:MAG: hypothetical protein A2Y38_16135 [Spirochaetes bacterium GWB1_59_5]|nr:MAG: hypothetical protein A2Y38_16135 [Spirochaetes bacterium GWB1_59_5]
MTLTETKEFLRREERFKDLQSVMSTMEGRRFIWRQLGETGVFRTSFVAGAADTTAFNEGSRNYGLRLLSEIMSELPDHYLIMQKEAVDNEQINKAEVNRNTGHGDSDD